MRTTSTRNTTLATTAALVLCLGCARTEEDPWVMDAAQDTALDTVLDTALDTGTDPLADTSADTAADTGAADTGTDTSDCPESPCGLVPQCGCPPGEKCSLVGSTRSCVPAGTGTKGVSCSNDSQCAPGYICLGMHSSEGATESACYPFCNSETECPGDASVCWEAISGTTDKVCSLGCDLLTGSGCPSGSKCDLFLLPAPYDIRITDCNADAGSGNQGSPCTLESQCGPGFFCGVMSGVEECIGYCTILPTDTCPFGCQEFLDEADNPVTIVFDGKTYGYCYY